MSEPQPGDTVDGRYVLERVLRRTACSVVFKANVGDRMFEIEVDLAPDAEMATRFLQSTRLANKFAPVFVLAPIDMGSTQAGQQYVVREYLYKARLLSDHLSGQSVAVRIAKALRFTTPNHVIAPYVMRSLLAGVEYAHKQQRVVLRDLRPESLLMIYDRSIRFADLRWAKALDDKGRVESMGQPTGTPPYRAPEQSRGEPIDPRADVYACGVIYYEVLLGERITPERPLALERISKRARSIVARATDPDPAKRFASADAFASAL